MLNVAKLIRRVKRKDVCFLGLNVLEGAKILNLILLHSC